MRGRGEPQQALFSYRSMDERIPASHPLRAMRAMVDVMLARLAPQLDALYAERGRASIPPEHLLRALLLQLLFSIRSERQLMEQLEAAASLKSVRRKDGRDEAPPPTGKNPTVNFHGERRSNQTHASTTDPDARLARKGNGKETKLCHLASVATENRHGLIVATDVRFAEGSAEVEAGIDLLATLATAGQPRKTVGADKGYDQAAFVERARALGFTAQVAQKKKGSAIDGRTTTPPGYAVSQRKRKLVEQNFGWGKTVGLLRKLRHRGQRRSASIFTFTCAAFNLVRLRTLLASPA